MDKMDYRVLEYQRDMGVFRRGSIYWIPHTWYHNTNNDSLCRRLVILPPDNPYAEGFPDAVRSWDEMEAIVMKAVAEQRKREFSEKGAPSDD